MITLGFTVLNGIQLGMLMFILAVGLTIIFGLMDTLNLAHGAFYTMGAYAGFLAAQATNSFLLAMLCGILVPFALGFLMQHLVLYPLSSRGRSTHLDLALLTFGVLFAVAGGLEAVFGSAFFSIKAPMWLSGRVEMLGVEYPVYRLFVIALGGTIAAGLFWGLERTVFGSVIRSGVENREMLSALGIDVRLMFSLVFAAGSALAGLAGVIAAPVFSIYSHMGLTVLVQTLVIVVVGGLGNVRGSLAGALIVGLADTLAQAYAPDAELYVSYALLFTVMVLRPQGLFGTVGRVA